MSKYVKDLMTSELRQRWDGVEGALVVDMMGMAATANTALRKRLRSKNMHLLVVKNSLARRATEGTLLAPAFEKGEGSSTVVWGGEDVVSLAKEVVAISEGNEFKPFTPKAGAMDGAKLSAAEVTAVSKWPSRAEQLSILVGQILSPGAKLASQLNGPGGLLASQIKKKGEEGEAAPAE
jgi:large subunit ribosomal protein L10